MTEPRAGTAPAPTAPRRCRASSARAWPGAKTAASPDGAGELRRRPPPGATALRRVSPLAACPRADRADRRLRRARAARRGGGVDRRGHGARGEAGARRVQDSRRQGHELSAARPRQGPARGRGRRDGRGREPLSRRGRRRAHPGGVRAAAGRHDIDEALDPVEPGAPRGCRRRTSSSAASSAVGTSTPRWPARRSWCASGFAFTGTRRSAWRTAAASPSTRPEAGRSRSARPPSAPGLVRDVLTDLLGMPEHRIRVIATDVGGGFGAKASLYPEEIATCVMARRLGRPVKWIGDRREDLLATTHAWDEIVEAELGLNRDGSDRGAPRPGHRRTSAPTRSIRGRPPSSRCRRSASCRDPTGCRRIGGGRAASPPTRRRSARIEAWGGRRRCS